MFFEGEIYNKQELGLEGSDAEAVSTLYEKCGIDGLKKIRGAFAFAFETENQVVLCRDQFGSVPFYYYIGSGKIFYGTSVREMLKVGVPRQLDCVGLGTFLAFGCLMHPWTMVKGVRCVHPGSCVVYNQKTGMVKEVFYWRPDFKVIERKRGELQEQITDVLLKSIARQVSKGGSPAAFLSGGIDSSAIVALMRKLCPNEEIRTYCVANENPQYDEREWARLVALKNKTRHFELLLTGNEIQNGLKQAIASYDQPSVDGLNFWFGFKLLKEAGEKILLSGEGGDELFFSAMGKQVLAHKYDRYFKWMPQSFGSLVEKLSTKEKFRKLGQLMGCGVPTFFITRRILSRNRIAQLLKMEFVDFSGLDAPYIDIKSGETDVYNYISWLDIRNFGADMYQRDGFQTAKAHGMKMRMPLYDVDLAELLYSVPGDIKYSTENPKFFLVNSCRDGIPQECIDRPKQGFSLPFKEYFQGELKEALDAFLHGETRLFQTAALRDLGKQFYAGKVYWSNVWIPFMAENWCRLNKIEL